MDAVHRDKAARPPRSASSTLGGYESVASWRVLDAFARRAGRWQLVHHTQTWLVAPVTPVRLNAAAQQAFVGRYAVTAGVVDSVHWSPADWWPPSPASRPARASCRSARACSAPTASEP